VYDRGNWQFSCSSELKATIIECWKDIESSTVKNLIDSMPNQCIALIESRENKTNY
jgi:hypothetical protein